MIFKALSFSFSFALTLSLCAGGGGGRGTFSCVYIWTWTHHSASVKVERNKLHCYFSPSTLFWDWSLFTLHMPWWLAHELLISCLCFLSHCRNARITDSCHHVRLYMGSETQVLTLDGNWFTYWVIPLSSKLIKIIFRKLLSV